MRRIDRAAGFSYRRAVRGCVFLSLLLLTAPFAQAGPRAMSVTVDPRLELLAVVHVLAREHGGLRTPHGPSFALNGLPYAREVERRFRPFRADPAVLAYLHLNPRGLDAPSGLALMSESFDRATLEFSPRVLPSHFSNEFSVDNPAQRAALVDFGRELSAFAKRSRFLEFFESRKPDFEALTSMVEKDLQGRDLAAEFERYAGIPVQADIVMYVCPLFTDFASSIDHRPAVPRISAYIRPLIVRGRPVFEYSGVQRKIWQELAHAAVDSLSETYGAQVAQSEALFKRLPNGGRCDFWRNCVRQFVARAVGFRLLQVYGKPDPKELAAQENPQTYDRITRAVTERLVEFESKRGQYPTLREFYPRLLEVFVELKDSYQPPE